MRSFWIFKRISKTNFLIRNTNTCEHSSSLTNNIAYTCIWFGNVLTGTFLLRPLKIFFTWSNLYNTELWAYCQFDCFLQQYCRKEGKYSELLRVRFVYMAVCHPWICIAPYWWAVFMKTWRFLFVFIILVTI